jgi:acetyl esterase/lipase
MNLIRIAVPVLLLVIGVACDGSQEGAPRPPQGYPAIFLLKAAHFAGLVDLVDTNPTVPVTLTVYKDLVYKTIGDDTLKLDIYQPKDLLKPRPVLIFIHGGGWKKGKKEDYLLYLIAFAQKGYITASISYRLVPQARYPAAVEDVKCAVRWIRAHAHDYLIDPDKIAVIGGSAGGHLALMIGYSPDVSGLDGECSADSVSSRVQAVVDLYGPADLTTEYARTHKTTLGFFGQTYDSIPELYAQASPAMYITADDPPTLIFHGTIDELVPVSQSDSLKQLLDRAGVPNEYHRLTWWPHTMDLAKSVNEYCQYYMNAFFEKHIPIKN